MDCHRQAPLSMGFSRQECWSGSPFPPPGDPPNPGIKPTPPAWQEDFLPLSHPGSPTMSVIAFHSHPSSLCLFLFWGVSLLLLLPWPPWIKHFMRSSLLLYQHVNYVSFKKRLGGFTVYVQLVQASLQTALHCLLTQSVPASVITLLSCVSLLCRLQTPGSLSLLLFWSYLSAQLKIVKYFELLSSLISSLWVFPSLCRSEFLL